MREINPITRVEGLGKVVIKEREGRIEDLWLEIYEAPRFFEALLKGKEMNQVLDIVPRICGLCPVAYQMSAVEAFEKVLGIQVPEHIKNLRRVFYCGEWVSSHSAHMFLLHLPDFFNLPSAFDLAKEKQELFKKGLRLREVGNAIVELVGGRHIHPINIKVGGFYSLPRMDKVERTIGLIEEAIPLAEEFLDFTLSLEFPDFERDYLFVSLGEWEGYPIMEGKLVLSNGTVIEKENYEEWFVEFQRPTSTALYSALRDGRTYLVGAIARLNNNYKFLPEDLKEKLKGMVPMKNPFKSIIARAVETVYALKEAKRLLEAYEGGEPYVEYETREGKGVGITEAPRGILFHKYWINKEGKVEFAKIVPPTSQNQAVMEEDLRLGLKLFGQEVLPLAEKIVRNHDPCISCASHFLKLVKAP
ncbi:Ni/Fe hydrogenase subunit alpha [Thermocrinis sp.]